MNQHPYLRAYMAGIVVPTVALLVGMTVFTIARHLYKVSVPIERILVFPMALVPNLWGLWNVLYVGLHSHRRLPLGFHGALLPFLLVPLGFTLTRALDFEIPGFMAHAFPIFFPFGLAVYYLAWKHLVGFFNELLGIA